MVWKKSRNSNILDLKTQKTETAKLNTTGGKSNNHHNNNKNNTDGSIVNNRKMYTNAATQHDRT